MTVIFFFDKILSTLSLIFQQKKIIRSIPSSFSMAFVFLLLFDFCPFLWQIAQLHWFSRDITINYNMTINRIIMWLFLLLLLYFKNWIYIFILVNNEKLIENQLGIRIIDSGIGNPKLVRDKYRKRGHKKYYLTIVQYVTSG